MCLRKSAVSFVAAVSALLVLCSHTTNETWEKYDQNFQQDRWRNSNPSKNGDWVELQTMCFQYKQEQEKCYVSKPRKQ